VLKKLKGKVSIITGGSHGIGKAITLSFAKEGSKIVIFSRNYRDIERVINKIRKLGSEAIGVSGNIRSISDINNLINKTLEEFKTIDILVNNAGGANHKPILETLEEDWDTIIDVHLKGPFLCSKAVAKVMIDHKKAGRIINISSVMGIRVRIEHPGCSAYQIAKAGLNHLTRSLAVELIPYGIYVNGIIPGLIRTRLTKEDIENNYQYYMNRCPAKRIGMPEDVAELALFLATENTKYIVGENIVIDGGQTIRE